MSTPKTPKTPRESRQNLPAPDEDRPQNPSPLAGWVKAATEGKTGRKGSSSLVKYLVVTGVVMAGFAFFGWMLVRARRKAARLSYDLRKKKEEQKRIVEEYLFSEGEVRSEEAKARVRKLDEEIKGLKEKLETQRKLGAERARTIEEATSWKDLGL